MMYIVNTVAVQKDGNIAKTIETYTDLKQAKSALFLFLASAYVNDNLSSFMGTIQNSHGQVIFSDDAPEETD